jgi:hypothetical protein
VLAIFFRLADPIPGSLTRTAVALLAHGASTSLSNPLFPSKVGTLRTAKTLDAAFAICKKAAGIEKRFTVHGLRYTFTDVVRRANVDAVVRRALTGHYSTVGRDEKRAAVAGVLRLVPPSKQDANAGGRWERRGSGRYEDREGGRIDDGAARSHGVVGEMLGEMALRQKRGQDAPGRGISP